MKHRRALLTALFTATFVVSPFVTEPFMGFRPDQLPIPQIDPPVQPAGYAFAIWGVIYAWLIVSAVFGLWRRAADGDWNTAREPLLICLGLGSFWLWLANTSAIGATVLIFIMAALAIAATAAAPQSDRWTFQTPAALLAGWLSAASFVSLGSTAAGYGLFFDAQGWAYACIIAALALGMLIQRALPRAPEYSLAIAWALGGIVVANTGRDTAVAALAAIGVTLVLLSAWTAHRRFRPA